MSFVFITGASSGIGESVAKKICDKYDIVINGRNYERLKAVGDYCANKGKKILLFPYDLSNIETLKSDFVAFIKEYNIAIECFIHFAGINGILPLSKSTYKSAVNIMNINFFAATECISCLLKKSVNANTLKNIILVSSIAAHSGSTHQPFYCASKGAIEALTRALARDLAPAVRVNSITPGSFKTRIWNTTFADRSNDVFCPPTLLPMRGPDEVANVVEFLLSEQSAYLTGVNIPVDAGERFNIGKYY